MEKKKENPDISVDSKASANAFENSEYSLSNARLQAPPFHNKKQEEKEERPEQQAEKEIVSASRSTPNYGSEISHSIQLKSRIPSSLYPPPLQLKTHSRAGSELIQTNIQSSNIIQKKDNGSTIQKTENVDFKDIIIHFYIGETKSEKGFDFVERDMNKTGRTEGGNKKADDPSTDPSKSKHRYIPVAGYSELEDMAMVLHSYDPNYTIKQLILSTGHGVTDDEGNAVWKVGAEEYTAKKLENKGVIFSSNHWTSGGSIHNWSCSNGNDKNLSLQIQRILSEGRASYYANDEVNFLMPGVNQTNEGLLDTHKKLEGKEPE